MVPLRTTLRFALALTVASAGCLGGNGSDDAQDEEERWIAPGPTTEEFEPGVGDPPARPAPPGPEPPPPPPQTERTRVDRVLVNVSFNLTAADSERGFNFTVPRASEDSRLFVLIEDSAYRNLTLGGAGKCGAWTPPGGMSHGSVVNVGDVKVVLGTLEDDEPCGVLDAGPHRLFVRIDGGVANGRVTLEATFLEPVEDPGPSA